MKYTNQLKVLEIAIREGGNWLPTFDFQARHGIFVGHRGHARISEMQKKYPEMIEVRTIEGKRTFEYRFKIDETEKFMWTLPPDVKKFVEETLKKVGRNYKVWVKKPVFLENGSVRMESVLIEK